MTRLVNLALICQLLSRVAAVENVGDEQCLLQTKADVSRHSDAALEPFVEPEIGKPGEVPEIEINLDLPPEQRYNKAIAKYGAIFKEAYSKKGVNPGAEAGAKKIAQLRGEETPELMGEIRGLAKGTDMPEYVLQTAQLMPSLVCMKGPWLSFIDSMNVSLPADELLEEETASPSDFLSHIQTPSFGTTALLAKEKDGSVWHARSLGFALPKYIQNLTYTGKFTKGGVELFRAQMIFPMVQPWSAYRKGGNGYSYQLNSRFFEKQDQGMELMKNLYMERRVLSGWVARKVLETKDNYEDAKKAFKDTPLPSPEYHILSGVKKGCILARDPDKLVWMKEIDDQHPYLVMTNFDYEHNDTKEFLQPTRVKGLSARVRAQNLLEEGNKKSVITAGLLQKVLNDRDVLSKNVLFQSLTNVEHDKYLSHLPVCANCVDAAAVKAPAKGAHKKASKGHASKSAPIQESQLKDKPAHKKAAKNAAKPAAADATADASVSPAETPAKQV